MAMAVVLAGLVLGSPSAAQALEYGTLKIGKNSDQTTYILEGGLIVPASEEVADILTALPKGKSTCTAKWFRSTHTGTWAYTVFDLQDCK